MKQIGCCFFILCLAAANALGQSTKWLTIRDVSLSEQVSLKDYKIYLSEIQKDSTAEFYRKQLPDSTIGSATQLKEYTARKKYESLAVVGISWESAMNYCYWLTKKEQPDSIRYYYRLPDREEWRQFFQLDSSYFKSGFEDWLVNPYDESLPRYYYKYYHKKSDVAALRRKSVVGSSLLRTISVDHPLYYYSDHGYKNVGFRLVKVERNVQDRKAYNDLLQYWNQ